MTTHFFHSFGMIAGFILLSFPLSAVLGSHYQRLTTCDCDGTQTQAWTYPFPDDTPQTILWQGDSSQNTCILAVSGDGCAWANNTCLELGPCDSPAAALFNTSAGITDDTIVFGLIPNEYPGVPTGSFPLCMDFNTDNGFIEAYAVRVCFRCASK